MESEKKDRSVLDIIIYGSLVKGKDNPEDVDILVIFISGGLRERLDKIQQIKQRMKGIGLPIDIKQITVKELFGQAFLAKTGIFLEGVSVFSETKVSELLGFGSYSLFVYDLRRLTHTQKVKFNYILSGRNGMPGLISLLQGKRIASSVVKIPLENALEFEEALKTNGIQFSRRNILEEM